MSLLGSIAAAQGHAGRVWRFANCEFDELRRELRVNGRRVELESKPLDLLLQLLLHSGEVVTKEELLDAVWPSVMVVDGSLATAVSKLRKAMGDEQHPVVLTVFRIGYRLAVPVYCKTAAPVAAGLELSFRSGDLVPGREQWRLERLVEQVRIERGLDRCESKDSRTEGVQVCLRRHPPEGSQARDHRVPLPEGIAGRQA